MDKNVRYNEGFFGVDPVVSGCMSVSRDPGGWPEVPVAPRRQVHRLRPHLRRRHLLRGPWGPAPQNPNTCGGVLNDVISFVEIRVRVMQAGDWVKCPPPPGKHWCARIRTHVDTQIFRSHTTTDFAHKKTDT